MAYICEVCCVSSVQMGKGDLKRECWGLLWSGEGGPNTPGTARAGKAFCAYGEADRRGWCMGEPFQRLRSPSVLLSFSLEGSLALSGTPLLVICSFDLRKRGYGSVSGVGTNMTGLRIASLVTIGVARNEALTRELLLQF